MVPPGFVVATTAYMAHIDSLKSQISTMLARINYSDANALDAAVAQIRGLDRRCTKCRRPSLPEITSLLREARVRTCIVAVRSSGTAEDLDGRLIRRPARHLSRHSRR